jgi:type IV secretory pathway TraG/TraD family ATPase VirD4
MLAAEQEVQPMVVAPPRAGKSSGYVIPWLLDHDGPALVLSTKRDIYDAAAAHRQSLGRLWVYDPFGDEASAGFTPLVPARTWAGAIRAGEALASAAHADASNAANEFWDKEAASMLAPLLHAAAISGQGMSELVRWLDARDFTDAISVLQSTGASAAADQLEGVSRRDERNRETTVMSALNLLRAYRYPQVAASATEDLTPDRFLDGRANTIYVVAAGHDQDALRPVILALVTAIYEAAIVKARRAGSLDPRLFILMTRPPTSPPYGISHHGYPSAETMASSSQPSGNPSHRSTRLGLVLRDLAPFLVGFSLRACSGGRVGSARGLRSPCRRFLLRSS